ncbi:MAG: tetratricopeptide repeat protein [Acidobacteria bacterium]|nr:tetratricopeptide repeat protein [Acidobacteriota bacterium]
MDKRMKKARRAHESGDLAAACLLYRKVAKDAPGDLDAWYLLGTAEAERGRLGPAAEAFARAEALDPRSAQVQNNLGNVLHLAGDLPGALTRYRRAVDLDPRLPQARYNLGRTALQVGELAEAETHLRTAVELEGNFLLARNLLGSLLLDRGQAEEARIQFLAVAGFQGSPLAAEARHFLDAMEGRNPARPPDAYVRRVFDGYAENFDRHLVEDLGYGAPELAGALVAELRPGVLARAADLGCGTGLSGAALRDRVGHLQGVDLAPRMLEAARAKGIYDSLEEGDAEAWLAKSRPATLDLVLALDVLVYVGDPGGLLRRCAAALAPGGLLVLTVESLTGELYRLLPSGRYAHDPQALRDLASACGLKALADRAFPLRRHGESWIQGWMGAFERVAPAPRDGSS